MTIKEKVSGVAGGAVTDKVQGERPGTVRALTAATVAGAATGAVVYRLLRS